MSLVDMQTFVGNTLRGSYVLQELVGEGSFGAVFRSMQLFLGVPVRPVAIKLSKYTNLDIVTAKALFADAFLLAQALQEMGDAEARQHLIHVYDMGILSEEENRGFIVTEYVRGTTLAAQFASFQRVPALLLVKWALQLCSALRRLHELVPPLVHRDLKPDNVLLGSDNILRIVDFGLAARLMHRNFAPGVIGAFSYMAPETMLGESVPASDVFSLGVMLYEGLTGLHPFIHLFSSVEVCKQYSREWIYKQMNTHRPPHPSHLNNTVSAPLDAVVLRCLEFYPGKRYRNAGALLRDLTEVYKALQAK